jgi:hypothetical protein
VIGAVLVLAVPIASIFNVVFWRSGPSELPVVPALAGAVFGLLVILGLAVFGVAAGLKGRRASGDSRPSPLATAGVVTGAAAIVLWIVVGIDLLAILISFIR